MASFRKRAILASIVLAAVLLTPTRAEVRVDTLSPGTPWETPCYTVDSMLEGPTVLLVGGLHGDEVAGYRAAEQIRRWPIARGRLVVVPRANVPAIQAGTRLTPEGLVEEALRNANRGFPSAAKPEDPISPPCAAIWALTQRLQPDWVVDLHEGFDYRASNPDSAGSSIISVRDPETDLLVESALAAVNAGIADPAQRLVALDGGVQGGLQRAAHDVLGAHALCLETTTKGQAISTRVRQHRTMVSALLRGIGILAEDCTDLVAPGEDEARLDIAIYDGDGAAAGNASLIMRIADDAPDLEGYYVGPRDVAAGCLAQFAAACFAGGSGSAQARSLGEEGRQPVIDYVRQGGGYVGICAGAYLASSHYTWSLALLNAGVLTGSVEVPGEGSRQLWVRGPSSLVEMELTEEGRALLAPELGAPVSIRYHNGPILRPGEREDLPPFTVLAHFRSEVCAIEAQRGTMVGSPAIVAGAFGEGRAVAISPHPEGVAALRGIVARALRWSAGR